MLPQIRGPIPQAVPDLGFAADCSASDLGRKVGEILVMLILVAFVSGGAAALSPAVAGREVRVAGLCLAAVST